MRFALRELRRRPGRFAVATGALSLIVVLLLLLGALLDGLFLGSTGAIRAQDASVFVYSADSRESFLRSRIDPALRETIESVDGVAGTGGLGITLLGARVPGEDDVTDASVIGYEIANSEVPAPPAPGEAFADRRLEPDGVSVGDTLRIGPARTPIEVVGWVDDASYLLQGGLWVEPSTWRRAQNASLPSAAVAPGVFQVVTVVADEGVDAARLASRIDAATDGATTSLTRDEAIRSLPGTEEQRSVFNAIIGVTFFVAGLVVALFFALLTIERIGLYGVLKAIGASSGRLAVGLVTQAVVVASIAFVVGALVTIGLDAAIPAQVPVQFERSRAVSVAIGVVVAAMLGGAVSFRRIVAVEPASAVAG